MSAGNVINSIFLGGLVVTIIKADILNRVFRATLVTVAVLVMAACGDIHGRDEFTKLTSGKSPEEVTTNIGKPSSVDSSNPARVLWTYNSVTYDIENQNKRDAKAVVVFAPATGSDKLRAIEVKFEH